MVTYLIGGKDCGRPSGFARTAAFGEPMGLLF